MTSSKSISECSVSILRTIDCVRRATHKLDTEIKRHEVIVPSGEIRLLQEYKLVRVPRGKDQKHSSNNDPVDKVEQTGHELNPRDDPEHVHVQNSEDEEVSPHDEDCMPTCGGVVGVVCCNDGRCDVGADIGDGGEEGDP